MKTRVQSVGVALMAGVDLQPLTLRSSELQLGSEPVPSVQNQVKAVGPSVGGVYLNDLMPPLTFPPSLLRYLLVPAEFHQQPKKVLLISSDPRAAEPQWT